MSLLQDFSDRRNICHGLCLKPSQASGTRAEICGLTLHVSIVRIGTNSNPVVSFGVTWTWFCNKVTLQKQIPAKHKNTSSVNRLLTVLSVASIEIPSNEGRHFPPLWCTLGCTLGCTLPPSLDFHLAPCWRSPGTLPRYSISSLPRYIQPSPLFLE